jgi:uncharacterized SAM-binding protein YcdF (DUF218 family)
MTSQAGVDRKQERVAAPGPRTCLLALLVLLSLLYLGLRGMGAFLITGDRLKQVDAVVVLGGGGEHRVEEAVRLIKEKYGHWLIITEPGELDPPELGMGSQFFRIQAVELGLSANAILITEKTAASTYEEALAVLHLMESQQFKSVIVVTDPFHTQRTRIIFRRIFDETGLQVRIHPVPGHWYRSTTWFLSIEGWGHTLREYIKLAGYLLGYYRLLE